MGSGEVVEGHVGDVGVGVVRRSRSDFIFDVVGSHCRLRPIDLVRKRLWVHCD